MTLQQIEYIIAVDEFRHFARAAKHCNVTQPTLSAMIQKLEEELDAKIFDRSKQPVAPTEVGRLVIAQGRQVLAEATVIKSIVEEEKNMLTGTFRLGILPTIAPYLLPRFILSFMRKYPQLDLRVVEMKTAQIKEALLTGEIDGGIVATLDGMEDFRSQTLFYEEFLVYGKMEKEEPTDVVRTADLQKAQLWLLDEGHCFRDQMTKFCQMKNASQSQLSYRLGSMETFMRMAEGGNGLTFIPELSVFQLVEEQKALVHHFAIPRPVREITLLSNPQYIRLNLLAALVEEIRISVPESMKQLKPTQQLV